MDIEKWLCGLGLQQYAASFRDNAIDAEILPELTEADLEKLGVVLGHRKRLLKAIATLASLIDFLSLAESGPPRARLRVRTAQAPACLWADRQTPRA